MALKKIFKILISLLLLISFLFMSIPISIRLLNPSFYDGPTLFRKTPTFEENPALFYDSFISSIQQPLLEKEEELLLLYYEAVDETEANKALKEMEISAFI